MVGIPRPRIVMSKKYRIRKVCFKKNDLVLIVNNKEWRFKLADVSSKLLKAGKKERELFKISASGYGIHWPGIDEDLSVEALLRPPKRETTADRP